MVAACCWFQLFCCLVTTEAVTFLCLVKTPNLIRCLLNNDTASHYNLQVYDTMWSGGRYQRFGGDTACILRVGVSQNMKAPTVIGGLLNNANASYYNLPGYVTMWSGGVYRRFGGAYCLHLQGWSQRSWKSGLYMSRSGGGGKRVMVVRNVYSEAGVWKRAGLGPMKAATVPGQDEGSVRKWP